MYQNIKNYLISLLKKWASSLIIRRLLGIVGGFKLWVVSFVFSYLWGKFLEPTIRRGFQLLKRVYSEYKAKKASKKLKEAKSDDKIDDAIDNLP